MRCRREEEVSVLIPTVLLSPVKNLVSNASVSTAAEERMKCEKLSPVKSLNQYDQSSCISEGDESGLFLSISAFSRNPFNCKF